MNFIFPHYFLYYVYSIRESARDERRNYAISTASVEHVDCDIGANRERGRFVPRSGPANVRPSICPHVQVSQKEAFHRGRAYASPMHEAVACPACGGSGGGPFGPPGSAWDDEEYRCPRCAGRGFVAVVSPLSMARPLAKGKKAAGGARKAGLARAKASTRTKPSRRKAAASARSRKG
jgi:DNA-directed RNA polymerase subunit RPC12/RpoP